MLLSILTAAIEKVNDFVNGANPKTIEGTYLYEIIHNETV